MPSADIPAIVLDSSAYERAASELYAGLFSDACDARAMRSQVAAPGICPVWKSARVCGRVRTMRAVATDVLMPEHPYAVQMEALDDLVPGDVVVAIQDPASGSGFWGELFSTAARARGALGAVIDGWVRDTERLEEMAFPVFARGQHPSDSLGRLEVVEYDEPCVLGGVAVSSGDLIFADIDGIVVVPADIAQEILEFAFDKALTENHVRDDLRAGALLREVWSRYRTL